MTGVHRLTATQRSSLVVTRVVAGYPGSANSGGERRLARAVAMGDRVRWSASASVTAGSHLCVAVKRITLQHPRLSVTGLHRLTATQRSSLVVTRVAAGYPGSANSGGERRLARAVAMGDRYAGPRSASVAAGSHPASRLNELRSGCRIPRLSELRRRASIGASGGHGRSVRWSALGVGGCRQPPLRRG